MKVKLIIAEVYENKNSVTHTLHTKPNSLGMYISYKLTAPKKLGEPESELEIDTSELDVEVREHVNKNGEIFTLKWLVAKPF